MCGRSEPGVLTKAGSQDSVTLGQLNDCISLIPPITKGLQKPEPLTKIVPSARDGRGNQKTDRLGGLEKRKMSTPT